MARLFSNNAQRAALTAPASTVSTTISVDTTVGWPDPTAGDVAIGAFDFDNANVEVFSYSGKTSGSFTGVVRGLDGTTAAAHSTDSTVGHIYSAEDLGRTWQVATFTTNQTVARTSYTHILDASSGNVTATLPIASMFDGVRFEFKRKDASVNTVTIAGNGSELIDAADTCILVGQYDSITVVSDGTQWWIT